MLQACGLGSTELHMPCQCLVQERQGKDGVAVSPNSSSTDGNPDKGKYEKVLTGEER